MKNVLRGRNKVLSKIDLLHSRGMCSDAADFAGGSQFTYVQLLIFVVSRNKLRCLVRTPACLRSRAHTHAIKPQGEGSSAHSRGKWTAVPVTAGAVMTSLHQISGMALDAVAWQPRGGWGVAVHLWPDWGAEALACDQTDATVFPPRICRR